jgi:hypothetical protein
LFDEPGEERAKLARQAASQLLAGEIDTLEQFTRVFEALELPPFRECSPQRMRFELPETGLQLLPEGYFFKGGAARRALGLTLRGHAPFPRDLDIVRFGSGWTEHDSIVSRSLMPQDFERGFGVEVIANLGRYMANRDLSVNEVVSGGGEVVASPLAVLDFIGGVLRPCKYRPGSIHRPPSLGSLTVVKMLRLRAEGLVDGARWSLVGVPPDQTIEPFDVAVQLDKAFSRSRRAAEVFIEQCRAVGIFPSTEEPTGAFIEDIAEIVGTIFEPERFFRNIPGDILAEALAHMR